MGNFPSDPFNDDSPYLLSERDFQRSANSEEYSDLKTLQKEKKQRAMSYHQNLPPSAFSNITDPSRKELVIPERWEQIYSNPGNDHRTLHRETLRFLAISKGYRYYKEQLQKFTSGCYSNTDVQFFTRFPWILTPPYVEDDEYFENWGRQQPNFGSEILRQQTKTADLLQFYIEICSEDRLEILKLKSTLMKQQGGGRQTSSEAETDKEDVQKLRRTCQENLTVLKGLRVVREKIEKELESLRKNEKDRTEDTEQLENILENPDALKTYAGEFTGICPDAWKEIPSASPRQLSRICEEIQDNHTGELQTAKNSVQRLKLDREFHHWTIFWKGLQSISETLSEHLRKCERKPCEEVPDFDQFNLHDDEFIMKCGKDSILRTTPVPWRSEFTVDHCKKQLEEIEKKIAALQSETTEKISRLVAAKKRHGQITYLIDRYRGLTEVVDSLDSAFQTYQRDYSLEVLETEHEKNMNDDTYIQQCGSKSKRDIPSRWKYICQNESWEGKLQMMRTTVDQLQERAVDFVKALKEQRQKRLNFQYMFRLWIGHNLMFNFLEEKNRLKDWTHKTEEENCLDDDGFILHYADTHPEVDKKDMYKRANIFTPIYNEYKLQEAEEKLKEFCNHVKRQSQTFVANFEVMRNSQKTVTAPGTSPLDDEGRETQRQETVTATKATSKSVDNEVVEAQSEYQRYTNLWKGKMVMQDILEKHLAECRSNLSLDVTKTCHEWNVNDEDYIQQIGKNSSTSHLPQEWTNLQTLQQHQEVNEKMKHACDELTEKLTRVVADLQKLRDDRTIKRKRAEELQNVQKANEELEEKRKQQTEELQTMQTANKILQDDNKKLKEQMDLFKKKSDEELKKTRQTVEQMKQKSQELVTKMKALETEKKQLETEKKQWEKDKKTYKKQMEDASKEIKQWSEKDLKTMEKLADKENECQRIRELNTGLQQELTKITSMCNQYKDKCGEYYKSWQLCYQDVQQRDQQIRKLQYKQQECQRYIDDLDSQVRDGKMKIQSLETEKEKLLTRLSKIAGAKLTQGNAAITDLSDANRPMKIAEKYSELYDNEWTDALEELLDNGAKDNDGIAILLEIITGAYKFCSKTAEKYQEGMTQSAVCLPVQPLGTHSPAVTESCDSQRSQQTAGAVQEPIPKTIQLTEEQKQILDDLRKALCPQLLHLVEEHYMSILDELLLKAFGKVKQIIVPCDHSRNRAADLSQEETDETILDVVGKPTKTGDAQIKQTDISDDPKSDVASKKSHGGSSDDVTDKENVQQYLHQEEERMKKLNKRDQLVRDIAHIENTSDLQHEEDLMKKSQEENQAMEGVDNEEKSNQLSHEDEEHRKKLKEKDQAAGDKAQQQLHQELDLVEKKMNEKRQSVSENGQTNDGNVEMVDMEHLVDEKREENEVHNQKIDQDKGDVHISKNIKKDDGSNRENDQTDVALDMDNHSKVTESAIKQQTVEENKIIEAVVLDGSFDKTKSFARKCANLCWFMRIKDPPLHMMYEVSCGCRMDTESFKHYTQSGKLVKFLVWPALFLHKEGALLAKGVAQPMKKTEEKEFQKKYSTAV